MNIEAIGAVFGEAGIIGIAMFFCLLIIGLLMWLIMTLVKALQAKDDRFSDYVAGQREGDRAATEAILSVRISLDAMSQEIRGLGQ